MSKLRQIQQFIRALLGFLLNLKKKEVETDEKKEPVATPGNQPGVTRVLSDDIGMNYPMIHLLPGMYEMILVVMKQQMNVLTVMQGMAATVGKASVCLNTVTHSPSQKMCMRYMP